MFLISAGNKNYRRCDIGVQRQKPQNGLQKYWDSQTYNYYIQLDNSCDPMLMLQRFGRICLPSALISLGPQAQTDDAGKFASARTIKKRKKHSRDCK